MLLKANEIDFLKLCKYHIDTNYTDPIAIQPDIIFLVKEREYKISSFTNVNFTNEEIILLATKINKYIKKDIIE